MKGALIVSPPQKEAWGFCPKYSFVLWVYIQNSSLGSKMGTVLENERCQGEVLPGDCNNCYRKDITISNATVSSP